MYRFSPVQFWISLAVVHALTWLFVWAACLIAPLSWQDKPAAPVAKKRFIWRDLWRAVSFGNEAGRAPFRKRCLDLNAFYWHAARARLKPVQVWVFLGAGVVWWLCCRMLAGDVWRDEGMSITTGLIVNSTLKLWITLEAAQRLAEDKRVGALELLLSTPLTAQDIIRGQFLALRRQFLKPVLAVVFVELGFMVANWHGNRAQDAQALAVGLGGTAMLVLDSAALSWVAIWTALTARAQQQAITSAVGLILILPVGALSGVAVIGFVSSHLIPGGNWEPGWKFFFWWWFGLGLAADLVIGGLARHKLLTGFHQLAARRAAGSTALPAATRG